VWGVVKAWFTVGGFLLCPHMVEEQTTPLGLFYVELVTSPTSTKAITSGVRTSTHTDIQTMVQARATPAEGAALQFLDGVKLGPGAGEGLMHSMQGQGQRQPPPKTSMNTMVTGKEKGKGAHSCSSHGFHQQCGGAMGKGRCVQVGV
jgi:hypothetical protein